VLADEDILWFFLGPVGWVCFIVIGALWLGIVALEQAALLGILCAAIGGKRWGVRDALQYAMIHARPIVRVTARMVAYTLLTAAPFLAAAGLVYFALLTEHDINFYLKEQPREFQIALGLGGVLVAGLAAVLLRLVTSWFFALPLLLFEHATPAKVLRESRQRATGHRCTLLLCLLGWFLATIVLSTLATSAVVFVGRLIVPGTTGSLGILVIAIGVTLIFWAVVNLVVNLLGATTFAAMLFGLYRHVGGGKDVDVASVDTVDVRQNAFGFALTRKRLLGAGVAGVVFAAAVGVVAVRTVQLEDRTEVTAHRGASASAPENTMAAFKQAIRDGADWIEIDVQETADGQVVVFHDSDFMKLAGVNLKIWDATMDDLKDIDIGSWRGAEFKDERVPTLGEVLRQCKGKARVNIELKYYGHDEQLERRVAEIVEANGMASDIVLMSLKIDAVQKMKSIRPHWKVGLLMSVSAGDLQSVKADFLAVNAAFANRRFIRSAHQMGRQVHVWTINDAVSMSTMIGRGVDGLITDKPALARSVLRQRAEMSPPERLLLELASFLGVTPEIGGP